MKKMMHLRPLRWKISHLGMAEIISLLSQIAVGRQAMDWNEIIHEYN